MCGHVCTDRSVVQFSTKPVHMFYETASSLHLATCVLAKTKPNGVSSTAIKIIMTCTKHKKLKLPTFLACLLLATSDRNAISHKRIQPLCFSDSSGMHFPLDNTYH